MTPAARMPILAALDEHRRLKVALKGNMEDGHPDEVALFAIEDGHLSGATPSNLAEAAALLRFAIVRSVDDLFGDEALRGESEPTAEHFERFMPEAWRCMLFLEQTLARDAAIDEAFGRWRTALLDTRRAEMTEEEVAAGCEAEDDAIRDLMALPAATPRGIAIKTFVAIHAEHGSVRGQPFTPLFLECDDLAGQARQALFADIVATYPDIAELTAQRFERGQPGSF